MKKVNEKVFYHIYPLGFCGAPHKNDYNSAPVERLLKIIQWIPHMKYLGVTSLYLGPVFESHEHGYDTVDYYLVDRRLGTNDTLRHVVSELKRNGIEVILDGVFNHVGRDFFAFRDLQSFGTNSKYLSWFDGVDFSKRSPYNDYFTYKTWAGHYNLVKLNLTNFDVSNHLIGAAQYWIDEFDIDGIRLDAADTLDFDFMMNLSGAVKNKKPDFWLMGEVVHGDYRKWINDGKLDSTTNYECYKGLYSSHNDKNYFEIAYSLKRQFGQSGVYKNFPMYNFADNHDVERVATSLKDKNHLFPLYTMLFAIPGVPSVYYGSEWKAEGRKGGYNDMELRPELDVDHMNTTKETDIVGHISKLSQIRKATDAIKHGSYKELFVKPQQFGFVREYNGEAVFVIVNSSDKYISIENKELPAGKYMDLLTGSEVLHGSACSAEIPPNGSLLLKKIG